MPQQFFPASDRPELTVDMTLRQNASIYATEAHVERMEALLKGDPDVDHYSTYVGRGAIRFILTLNVQLANPFFAQFVIVAKDIEARERLQVKLEKILAEEFPDVVGRVSPLELGPPVGWPLQYRVSGPDKDEVRRLSLELAQVLGSDERTRHVNFDWMEPARQLRVKVNQDQARQLGISSQALAGVLNAAVTGTTVTQVRDDIYLVNVVARATDSERASFETLSSLQVPTPSGRMVPLKQFATFVEEQEFPMVWRRDRVPTLTVRADVMPGVLPDTVVTALAPKIDEFAAKLPKHYRVATGGLYEESAISSASVFAVVPLMIVLMLTIMMVMLVSFRRLAMVVAILPLGLIGVVMALLLFNRPLGFVAILGVLALIGMIAKNAVILIVQIESDRAEGKGVLDAVLSSATGRLRPMMLTAISTVFGLIPIAPTVFWGPMAFAIMGGLMVATLLTLVFLPTVYVAVFGNDKTTEPAPAGSRSRLTNPGSRAVTPDLANATSIEPPETAAGRSRRRDVLDLYLEDTRQLFNSMDPAPFRQRDLDPNATAYIVDWAEEATTRRPLRMVLHLGCETKTEAEAVMVSESVRAYFRRRAQATRRQLQHLFRIGRYSLLIALVFLALVIVIGEYLASVLKERYASLVEDSLVIGAWVALWRPLEIFLYDWWPIRAEAQLFDRLSLMDVQTVTAQSAERASDDGPQA